MNARSRFKNSMLAGVIAGIVLTWFQATHRHAVWAAAVATRAARSQHESVTSVLAAGFALTTVAVGLALFTAATLYARWRARRAVTTLTSRRGTGSYSGYGDQW